MHQNTVRKCMRLVANWELDCVKASQRDRLDRIRASTPTLNECRSILKKIDPDSDDDVLTDYRRSLKNHNRIWGLVDRCRDNMTPEPNTYPRPLLNCCPDIFTKCVLDDVQCGACRGGGFYQLPQLT